MSTHYPNAPITEAIIDIRAPIPTAVNKSQLARIQKSRKTEFPKRAEGKRGQAHFRMGREVSAAATAQFFGHMFISTDGLRVFQAKRDGFTFSRLAPYGSWQPFRNEAKLIWEDYRRLFSPETVNRLAVRYINRIDLPLPIPELKKYLVTAPDVSNEMPSSELARFFMQLAIPQNDIKSMLVLNEALVEPAKPNHASVILDIDVFREEDVPQDETGIWDFFEELHDRKNDVFEACITDETRRLFE